MTSRAKLVRHLPPNMPEYPPSHAPAQNPIRAWAALDALRTEEVAMPVQAGRLIMALRLVLLVAEVLLQ